MTEIDIDSELAETITERIEGTNFESVDEYVEIVLREVLAEESASGDDGAGDRRDVQDQLEELGYL